MSWESQLRCLAADQFGVVGLDQMPGIGLSWDHWWRARRTGRWQPLTRRVLRLAGTPVSDEQRVHTAIQDTGGGAALHADSALAWLGMRYFDLAVIHTVRRRETTNGDSPVAAVHRLRDLDDRDVVIVKGVPVVRAIRAIWSVASAYSAARDYEYGCRRVGRILDDAHLLGVVSWAELHESIDLLGRPGRAGTRIMRALGEKRTPGDSPTESRNEDRFEEVLFDHAIRPPRRQVVVGGHRPIGRADFRDDELPVVFEVNSKAFHTTPSDRAADRDRHADMTSAGFTVGVVWDDDLWRNPSAVVELVRTARSDARREKPSVLHTPSCPWPFDPDRRLIGRSRPALRG